MYLHRQSSGLMLFVLVAPVAVLVVLAWTTGEWWMYLLVLAFVLLGWTFSSLTIEVTDRDLVSYFGNGFWRKRVPLDDIISAQRTTSSTFEGWGIRITTRGMLYNVAGHDAVEVRLASGQHYRLGTDDPEGLVNALQAHLRRTAAS